MGFLHSNAMEDGVLSMDAGHSLITKNSIKAMSSPILTPLSHSFCTYYQRTYPFPIKHLIQIKLFEYEHNNIWLAHRCPKGPTTELGSTETPCLSALTGCSNHPLPGSGRITEEAKNERAARHGHGSHKSTACRKVSTKLNP